MITLYMRPTCPYCRKVKDTAEELGIKLEYRDISEPAFLEELIQRGGKQQVPYMVDTVNGVEMYESSDIIDYLHTTSLK